MRCSATGMTTALKAKRDQRGDIEVIGVLHVGLPGDRQGKHDGLQREDVEKRVKTVLVEQHEADQHQSAGEQMGDVEGETLHFRVLETKPTATRQKGEHQGGADEIGHAEDAHLGDAGFEQGRATTPATASLPR